jgi:hypothetical protein
MPQSSGPRDALTSIPLDQLFSGVQPTALTPFNIPQTNAAAGSGVNLPANRSLMVPRTYTDDPTNTQLQTLHPAVRISSIFSTM